MASYGNRYPGAFSRGYDASGYSRGGGGGYNDYSEDVAPGGSVMVNPDYHHKEHGYGYEGTRADAIDPFETPMAKKRKIENVTICVDFVRGFCSRGQRCPKPHVDYVESIDEREIMAKLKFCHDFQNKGSCSRDGCKFLHVSRLEEDEFLLTGTIPQTVFQRMRDQLGAGGGFASQDQSFESFERSPHSHGGRGRGVGGARGRGGPPRRPSGGSYNPASGGGGHGRGGFSGSGRGAASSGHSSSQPITYSNFCVDYLKGDCAKGQACYLKHVETIDDPETRDGLAREVFCHDFQNQNCHRPFCKYVHASRQEESFFLENGFFPPSLNARNRDKMFFSDICIDFLRSQCVRGSNCQFQHVEKVESMTERVCLSRSIFCHDFQDPEGCTRPTCKLLHTDKEDEQYFIQTGMLPPSLCNPSSTVGAANVSHLTTNVCREYVKNACNRGDNCRFYHPTPAELQAIIAEQNKAKAQVSAEPADDDSPSRESLVAEIQALKSRNQQLERLLADACHCITLAVAEQNPAITSLMKTIAEMAPASALPLGEEAGTIKSESEVQPEEAP